MYNYDHRAPSVQAAELQDREALELPEDLYAELATLKKFVRRGEVLYGRVREAYGHPGVPKIGRALNLLGDAVENFERAASAFSDAAQDFKLP